MKRAWISLVLFGVALAPAAALGLILRVDGATLAIVSPAAGMLFAALLTQPKRRWFAYMAVGAAAHWPVEYFLAPGATLHESVFVALLNAAQAFVAAHMVLLFLNKPRRRATGSETMAYGSIAALVTPGLAGLVAAVALHYWRGTGYYPVSMQWWSANLLGIALVTPTFLMHAQLREEKSGSRRPRVAESFFVVALLIATSLFALGPNSPFSEAFGMFAVVPFLLWLALRADPRVVGGAILAVFVIAALYASHGQGPFYVAQGDWQGVYGGLQLFFLVFSISALVVSWAVYDRQHAAGLFLRRVSIGDFIADFSKRFARTPFAQLDGDIRLAIQRLGQFASADRVWLIQLDTERQCVSVSHSWTRDGVENVHAAVDGLPFDRFPWSVARLSAGEQVLLQCKEPPAGSEEDVKSLTLVGTRAIGYMPLFGDNNVIGAIGFDWVNGDPVWSDDVVALLNIVGQLFVGALRRQRNRHVINQYERRLRDLATEVVLAEERTRRQTAVDLHDGIGQNLAVACIKIGQLENEIGASHPSLVVLHETVGAAMRQTRNLVSELSPSMLYELGIASALRSLVQSMSERWPVNIEFDQDGEERELSEAVSLALYRTVRELLTNTVKHAGAGLANVQIGYRDDEVTVLVSDDGVGFDVASDGDAEVRDGFGLFSIRERTLSLGGTMDVESSREKGTRVRLTLPYGEGGGRLREYDYDMADSGGPHEPGR